MSDSEKCPKCGHQMTRCYLGTMICAWCAVQEEKAAAFVETTAGEMDNLHRQLAAKRAQIRALMELRDRLNERRDDLAVLLTATDTEIGRLRQACAQEQAEHRQLKADAAVNAEEIARLRAVVDRLLRCGRDLRECIEQCLPDSAWGRRVCHEWDEAAKETQ